MKLYFGSFSSVVSTLLIVGIIIYMVYTLKNQNMIKTWGRKTALLALIGLAACIFTSTRDGYFQSVQATMDSSVMPGVFTADSIQSTLCSFGGAAIGFSIITSIFIKKQWYRKAMFLLLSAAIIFKVLIIEISRIFIA